MPNDLDVVILDADFDSDSDLDVPFSVIQLQPLDGHKADDKIPDNPTDPFIYEIEAEEVELLNEDGYKAVEDVMEIPPADYVADDTESSESSEEEHDDGEGDAPRLDVTDPTVSLAHYALLVQF